LGPAGGGGGAPGGGGGGGGPPPGGGGGGGGAASGAGAATAAAASAPAGHTYALVATPPAVHPRVRIIFSCSPHLPPHGHFTSLDNRIWDTNASGIPYMDTNATPPVQKVAHSLLARAATPGLFVGPEVLGRHMLSITLAQPASSVRGA
jgi:hypothetical protein